MPPHWLDHTAPTAHTAHTAHYALCTMHYALHMYCTHCTVTAHHAHCTHCIRTQHTVCSTFHPLHKCTLSVSHWTKHCSAITVISLTTVHYTRRSFVLHCLKEHEHWAEIILILYCTLYNPICAHCYPLTTKKTPNYIRFTMYKPNTLNCRWCAESLRCWRGWFVF